MFSFPSNVRFSETDEDGRLTTLALLNYFQDCTVFHSGTLGLGPDNERESGKAWLLAAWQIEIEDLPSLFDPIVVSTWGTGAKGTFATRNFTMATPDGRTLARADSLWFLYDAAAGRPVRLTPEDWAPYMSDDAPLDMPPTSRKLRVEGPGEPRPSVAVAKHHLDTNHHVNNAQYVEIAREALGTPVDVQRIQVQYKRAAVLGDTIVPVVHAEKDGMAVRLTDGADADFAIVKLLGREP